MRRTSATGTSGFTLIEILVVVAITGIILVVAAVNLFPDERQIARRESGTLALSIERSRDAAWFGGRPMALAIGDGYLYAWQLRGNEWRRDGDHEQRLDSSLHVTSVYVDGQPLKANDKLVFLPDGLGVPFRISLEVRGYPWAIEGDAAGAVTLSEG
ncbi:MAG TPA: prepilin-type N-terminal cleavage/methylation domain-containing protein [Usitatibacter sp.]|nr:prepilin-type N-terminal cleavage/methylation domain-containing protein [Casimicrobiaceae bacterium]HTS85207.1 prepilin-type N-terminal cleavage/methylation domain-containing protein [Usitatibacter sp.]